MINIILLTETIAEAEAIQLNTFFENLDGVNPLPISHQDFEFLASIIFGVGQSNIEGITGCSSSWISDSKYNSELKNLINSKYLSYQFDGLDHEILKAATYRSIFVYFLKILEPKLVIFGHDSFVIERTLCTEAQNQGVMTVTFLHYGFGPKFSFEGLVGHAKKILIWSDSHRKYLQDLDIPMERLEVVGAVRYKKLLQCKLNGSLGKFANDRKGLSKFKKEFTGVILICTAAINTGFCSAVAEPAQHRKVLRDLIEWVGRRGDLLFIIKPHPSFDYYDLYSQFQRLGYSNFIVVMDQSLKELLFQASACVMLNYCTTAGLESMLQEVPIFYFTGSIYALPNFQDNAPINSNSRFSKFTDLIAAVEKLIDLNIVDKETSDKNLESAINFLGGEESMTFDRLEKIMSPFIIGDKSIKNGIELLEEFKVKYKSYVKNFETLNKKNDQALTSLVVNAFLLGREGRSLRFIISATHYKYKWFGKSLASRKKILFAWVYGRIKRKNLAAVRIYSGIFIALHPIYFSMMPNYLIKFFLIKILGEKFINSAKIIRGFKLSIFNFSLK